MIYTTLFPNRYIQGPNSLQRLGTELSKFGPNSFAICTPFFFEKLILNFQRNVNNLSQFTVEKFGGECSDEEIDRLSSLANTHKPDIIVGIGGGKTLDTAKAVAYELKLPVAIVPTIASSDAPCSALSVIYTQTGRLKRFLILPKNPDIVLVDTSIIAGAPIRFLVSGMGDALSTWFEAESCKKKYARNATGDLGSMTAYALATLCYKTIIKYGSLAKLAGEKHVVTSALEHIVEANTLLSAIGFESGGVAAAHAIHNGLTILKPTHKYLHGEKVAFGTFASLFLTDKSNHIIDEVFSFCKTVGLPTTLAEVGLPDVSDVDLMKVAESACAEDGTIHNEPIPVTPKMVFSAIKIADAFAKSRSAQ